jgi:hypothetical protein
MRADDSEELVASIIRVKQISKLGTVLAVISQLLQTVFPVHGNVSP